MEGENTDVTAGGPSPGPLVAAPYRDADTDATGDPTGPVPAHPASESPPAPTATGAFPAPPWPPAWSAAPGWPPPPPGWPPPPVPPPYLYLPPYPGHPAPPAPRLGRAQAALLGALAAVGVVVLVAAGLGVALFGAPETWQTTGPDKDGHRIEATESGERLDDGALRETADNPLYTLDALPETDCALPPLDPASTQSWEAFVPDAGACLDAMWSPLLAEIGVDPEPVEYVVEPETSDKEFGDDLILGHYQNNRITITVDGVAEVVRAVPGGEHEGAWLGLVAHEYAHYVQDHTGILDHSWHLESQADTEEEALELLRRSELQAECLSGAVLGATGRYDYDDLVVINDILNGGDDSETHGSRDNRQAWLRDGWTMQSMADCNTYTADTERVR